MMKVSNGRRWPTVCTMLIVFILNVPSWQSAAATNQADGTYGDTYASTILEVGLLQFVTPQLQTGFLLVSNTQSSFVRVLSVGTPDASSDLAVKALQNLYNYWSTQPSNMMPRWAGNDPCGTSGSGVRWAGVVCDASSTYVVTLTLISYNLTGGIPTYVGDLASLTSLDLSFNAQLGRTIPPQLGNLLSLTNLALIGCGLNGNIPAELGKLVNLKFLALNQNNLTGSIPPEIGNLVSMTWFDISENSISSTLPVATATSVGLDNLSSVAHFHFYNNSLGGNIPPEIFNIPTLVHMLLSFNNLQGSIPNTTLGNAKSLSILSLDNNHLTGPLPAELNQITTLSELHLNGNGFTGILPNLAAVTGLQLLSVGNNPFNSQAIPAWTYSLNAALTIAMPSCNLTGALDASIFSLAAIQSLDLSDNELSGSVRFASPSSTLALIDLENNHFTEVDNTSQLQGSLFNNVTLMLSGNDLCKLSIYSGSTVCQGSTAPAWTPPANSSCKQVCDGGEARLNPYLCSCANPLVCHMQLTAPTFRFINNTLITNIANEFSNDFEKIGVISQGSQVYIGNATFTNDGRMLFDLSVFPLSGDSLNTTAVNVITNALTSQLFPLKEGPYIMRNFSAPPTSSSSSKSKTSIGMIVGIAAAGAVVLVIIALIALYAIRQKKRAEKAETSRPFASWGATTKETGEAPELKGARWFSLAELKKVTDNFSEDNEIGAGGYGKVYKAVLPNGKVVAVKRADQSSVQGAVEFKNEIELLSRVHHRNLVGLVGFCYENGEQALVYEFVPNGSLRDHLLGHYEKPLSWEMRVVIALGSAKGLTYLHELANPPIIHRDIKSGNILLDETMMPKVSDFGLSKLAAEGEKKAHISTQVKGTLGYLDPEYYMTSQLSEKSDVYSFGVVLLEMLSARPPIERGRYIVREVRNALNKGGIKALEPLLDPLLGDYPKQQMEAFLDVALLCVEEVAAGRPTMNEVVKKLEVIAGNSHPNSGVHITVEPQKDDDYAKNYLHGIDDRSFQYSGAFFTSNSPVEPK